MAKSTGKVEVRKAAGAASVPAVQQPVRAHPIASLRREIDRLFDDFAAPLWPAARGLFDDRFWRFPRLELATPAVDVTENEAEYLISAELPGVDEKDVEVTLSGDVLTLKGEKKEETEKKGKGYHVSERRFGSVQRSFSLPPGVEPDKISAQFAKGVLTITLPKGAQARKQPKRIEVKTG
jgi:HSP20 family protein